MHRVLMNYQRYRAYTCHFIEADCKTTNGQRTRFIEFATLDEQKPSSTAATPTT
jgi:hypothetical protein